MIDPKLIFTAKSEHDIISTTVLCVKEFLTPKDYYCCLFYLIYYFFYLKIHPMVGVKYNRMSTKSPTRYFCPCEMLEYRNKSNPFLFFMLLLLFCILFVNITMVAKIEENALSTRISEEQ